MKRNENEHTHTLTFDRVKIKANYKYLLNTKIRFNDVYNSRSGVKTGIFYSSKDDFKVPFNLYIAVDYIRQTLTIEFSSKILKENYHKLISKTNIRECLDNINQMDICEIDVNGILSEGCFNAVDITRDCDFALNEKALDALNTQVANFRRFKWKHYEGEGITFTKDVKCRKCTETITLYNKEKEITTGKNKNFLRTLPEPQKVIDHFKGKTRFEITLDTSKKIMSYLNIENTYISTVLNAKANPVLTQFDRVFGKVQENNIEQLTFDNYDDFSMKILLEHYQLDLKRVEQEIRDKFASRSGLAKRLKKLESIHKSITSASTGENLISKVRSLLL